MPETNTWQRLSEARVCLGTMYFGTTVAEPRARQVLDRYLDRGGRLVDTANCYSFWVDGGTGEESERVVGRWLADRGARDDVLLATKVGSRPRTLGAPWPEQAEGLTARVIHDQFARSAERLGTDRVDLYYAHIDDPRTDLAETLGAFARLVERGAVGVVGASNLSAARLRAARDLATSHGWPGYQVVQQRHSYLAVDPGVDIAPQVALDQDLLAYAATQPDLLLHGYSPLLGGAYTRPDKPLAAEYQGPTTQRRLAALREVAARLNATPNQVVLAWMLASTPRVVPVLGVSSVAQLDEAMDALTLDLDQDALTRLTHP
ncbi:aldo/keto reductase [Goodfellowiella coeruleoviolacea]|uniref:Oxidoreductase n=1 Tax=Goodfellowiella coeruleoviolacea TaxID=334858 RepID=A0AAE3GEP0_9PSEU|nr:aldo/keto reductase [Goodfellowiella coeruleoviolacea]MCP2166877.1 putative oxidoreductase [Goodfellowiella coeruleoviolacea]